MKTIAAAVIASLFAVAPAMAAPKSAPNAEPSPVASAAAGEARAPLRGPNTRYCYQTVRTGSNIVMRECKTRDAWKEIGVTVPANL